MSIKAKRPLIFRFSCASEVFAFSAGVNSYPAVIQDRRADLGAFLHTVGPVRSDDIHKMCWNFEGDLFKNISIKDQQGNAYKLSEVAKLQS